MKGTSKFFAVAALTMALALTACQSGGTSTGAETSAAESAAPESSAAESAAESASETAASDTADGESSFKKAEGDLMKALEPLPKGDPKLKIAAIESTLSNPFWITMEEGYKDAAKEFGMSIDVKATETETDTTGQLDILKNFISQGYNGVAFSPLTEQNMLSGIVEANKADVKVVCIGNQVDQDALQSMDGKLDATLALDFYAQGKLGGEFIAKNLKEKGKVAVIEGIPGATQSEGRKQGALDAFKAAGLEVLPVQTANFERKEAYDVTVSLLTANPDIVGIACGNDVMALGVVEALESKGMKDKVLVVGVDFIEEAKTSIEEGKLDATVAMTPYLLGKAGTILTLKAMEGQEIPADIDWNASFLVDKTNVSKMDGWK